MLSTKILNGVSAIRGALISSRNLGVMAPSLQKATDPIQQLFLNQIKSYKSKSTGGKLVEPTPEIEREMKAELEKLAKAYGGDAGTDMTKFPSFKFEDAALDPINQSAVAAK